MASLKDIRKRIKSAKSTEKITKAMKLVSAAKLRRAQEEVRQARPFALKLGAVVADLAMRLEFQGQSPNALLKPRETKNRAEVIVLTSDRGLCGGFNGNVLRRVNRLLFDLRDKFKELHISTIGRKGFDALRNGSHPIRENYQEVFGLGAYLSAIDITSRLCQSFISGELDAVYLIYNEFNSAISQTVVVKQMLPVVPTPSVLDHFPADFIYEPSQAELLERLLPRYFATKLFQALLESQASEHGARMTAMDNAVRNANEMISELTLQYNRARQAVITKELMEIISGSEAL